MGCEAQARTAYRSVYRSERLLGEDEQQLQANLAEMQRRLGMESIAFHTRPIPSADLLQEQRFGKSPRRTPLLVSLRRHCSSALCAWLLPSNEKATGIRTNGKSCV